jgi:hypothetical protein
VSEPQEEKVTPFQIATPTRGFSSPGCAQDRTNDGHAESRREPSSLQHIICGLLQAEGANSSRESALSRLFIRATKFPQACLGTQIYPTQQRASKAADLCCRSQAKLGREEPLKPIHSRWYGIRASSTVEPKAPPTRGSSSFVQPALVGCIGHLRVIAHSLTITIKALPFAAALISTTASSQPRPTTTFLQCSQASGLVKSQGAVVISTGQFTYERFVADVTFCVRGEVLQPIWTKTADVEQCFIGYRCGTRTAQQSSR